MNDNKFTNLSDDAEVIWGVIIFAIVISIVVPLIRTVWDDFGRGYGGNPQEGYYEEYYIDY